MQHATHNVSDKLYLGLSKCMAHSLRRQRRNPFALSVFRNKSEAHGAMSTLINSGKMYKFSWNSVWTSWQFWDIIPCTNSYSCYVIMLCYLTVSTLTAWLKLFSNVLEVVSILVLLQNKRK
jgi:hypothetical protein